MDPKSPIDEQEEQGDSNSSATRQEGSPSDPPNPSNPSHYFNVPTFRCDNPDDYVNHPYFADFLAQNISTWQIWQPTLIEYAKLHQENSIGCGPRDAFMRVHEDEPDTPLNAFTTFPLTLWPPPGSAAATPAAAADPPEPQPGPSTSRQGVLPSMPNEHPIEEGSQKNLVEDSSAGGEEPQQQYDFSLDPNDIRRYWS